MGAAGMVTGSCHLVEFDSARVPVDCGVFQGEDAGGHQELGFDACTIDAVVLTHAHLDHLGRPPRLYEDGYRGKAPGYAGHRRAGGHRTGGCPALG
ncbi:MAG TPA: hypothetical protein DCM14_01295 [Clostridiales bacterium UBA8153]|nr:hypothetical protein [Clostridiales bacterium UBA8153]